jgi:hypothetical protein
VSAVETSRYLLHHRHHPHECGAAFASFSGHDSPLRRRRTVGSCPLGGHEIWWLVSASSEDEALRLLPYYVAKRTTAVAIAPVQIP